MSSLPILCNLECLVFFARGCLYLRLATRFGPSQLVGGSPVFYGPARLLVSVMLPVLDRLRGVCLLLASRGGSAVVAHLVGSWLAVGVIGTPCWRSGTARTSLPARAPCSLLARLGLGRLFFGLGLGLLGLGSLGLFDASTAGMFGLDTGGGHKAEERGGAH